MAQIDEMKLAAKYAALDKPELAQLTYLPLVASGNPQAMVELALLLLDNPGIRHDSESAAKKLLHDAVELGYAPAASALVSLPKHFRNSTEPTSNLNVENSDPAELRELKALIKRARSGDVYSLRAAMRKFCEITQYFESMFDLLVELALDAIDNGETSIFRDLASVYLVRSMRKKAEYCLNSAVFHGDREALNQLIKFYPNPRQQIFDLLEKVALDRTLGNISALAQALKDRQLFESTAFWYERTIDLGYLDGAILLANLYRRDMRDLGRFKSLATSLEKRSLYHAYLIQADALVDNRAFKDAARFYELSLSVNPRALTPLTGIQSCFKRAHAPEGFKNWLLIETKGQYAPNVRELALKYSSQRNVGKAAEWQALANLMRADSDSTPQDHFHEATSETNSHEEKNSIDPELLDSFELWLKDGHEQIAATYITKNSNFLKSVFKLNFQFCPPTGNWMQYHVSDDWLDEILAKYEDQTSLQDLSPDWPIRFESDELQIVLSVEGNWLRAFVGKRNSGGLVAIRLNNFEIRTALTDDDRNFAVGIAVSFFLDRTITLGEDGHPHFNTAGFGLYTGTSGFQSDINRIRLGSRSPMKAHKVSGFIRNLPKGHNPSDDAISRAPIYVRRNMKPGQTFVREHQRSGSVDRDLVVRYLKKNSHLADAIGSLSY